MLENLNSRKQGQLFVSPLSFIYLYYVFFLIHLVFKIGCIGIGMILLMKWGGYDLIVKCMMRDEIPRLTKKSYYNSIHIWLGIISISSHFLHFSACLDSTSLVNFDLFCVLFVEPTSLFFFFFDLSQFMFKASPTGQLYSSTSW